MAVVSCQGSGCARSISITPFRGGNDVARASPEHFAMEWARCPSCRAFTCDRCVSRQRSYCGCGALIRVLTEPERIAVAHDMQRELDAMLARSAPPSSTSTATAEPPSRPPLLQIQWNALPLVTRERLLTAQSNPAAVGCFRLRGVSSERVTIPTDLPDPSLAMRNEVLAATGVAALLLAALCYVGFGDPESDTVWLGPVGLTAFAVFSATLPAGAVYIARKVWERPARPYADGFVMGPLELIEFRGAYIRIRPLDGLEHIRFHNHYGPEQRTYSHSKPGYNVYNVTRAYLDSTVVLPLRQCEITFRAGNEFRRYLSNTIAALKAAFPQGRAADVEALRRFDLLFEARSDARLWNSLIATGAAPPVAAPEGPGCVLPAPTPRWLRPHLLLLVAGGAAVGCAAWLTRNCLSDTLAYEAASRGGLAKLRSYAALGWLYTSEARELLPYVEARESGDSLRALLGFLRQHPRHAKADEARALIRRAFAAAQRSAADSAELAPAAAPFLREALRHQEAHGAPWGRVRLSGPGAAPLAALDREAREVSARFGEMAGELSPHFADEASMRLRERAIADNLQRVFEAVFPAGLLPMTSGGASAGDASSGVTFEVTCAVANAGRYASGTRREHGASITFDVVGAIPGGAATFRFATTIDAPDGSFTVPLPVSTPPLQTPSEQLDRAFILLNTRLRQAFFQPGAPLVRAMPADDSPSLAPRVLFVPPRWRATVADPARPDLARVNVRLLQGGDMLSGTWERARRGPPIEAGAITMVPLRGRVLATTCADASGASGPCVFTFDALGTHFTAVATLGAARTFWRGEARY